MERNRRESGLMLRMSAFCISFIFCNICFGAEKNLAPSFFEYHIIDTSRQEIYSQDQSHPFRELMMHVWIPYDVEHKQYPLILFSHGLGYTYNGMTYTYLCQTIAQQGYIVASISHAYSCKPIQFPDGRIAEYCFSYRLISCHQDKHASNVALAKLDVFDREVELWIDDMLFALNECQRLFDVARVAIVGHSLGGSTALQVCRRDNRITAAINLDGPLYGDGATIPFDKPVLCIIGSSVLPYQITSLGKVPMYPALLWRQYFNQAWLPALSAFIDLLPQSHAIVIENIVHDTFTDYAFVSDPIIQPWLIDGAIAHCAIVGYVCEFLNCYLKN